jgi:fermentation-respiration switch protein FrsA (DUF1100 family)
MLVSMTAKSQETSVRTSTRSTLTKYLLGIASTVLGLGLLGAFGMLAALFGMQTRIIFPGSDSQGKPEAQLPPGLEDLKVILKTASGDRVVALFGPALTPQGAPHPDAAHQPTLLYFYGNGMCLSAAAQANFAWFRRLGVNVMIPDYLGYGLSGGEAGEQGCYQTADACYEHLIARKDIDPHKIVIGGRSLGGGVAIDLASRRPVAGLIAFCTFTSLTEMTRKTYPGAPTFLLRHKFDSLSKIGRVGCPILLGHGALDSLVPCSMSKTLAEAAKAPVTFFVVDDAEHNDFYDVGERQVHDALVAFFKELKAR